MVQSDDYYPFGLAFNSYQRENSTINRWKFQGQEHVDDLGLGWDSFKWRNHQQEIGRFFNIDPLAEKYVYNSPYAFAENRVIDGRELEGLEWVNSTGQLVYDPKANDGKGGYTEHATRNDKHVGSALMRTNAGGEQFNKLVNSDHPTEININNGKEAARDKEGDLVMGVTKNTNDEGGRVDYDFDPKGGLKADIGKSTITINLGSIDEMVKNSANYTLSDQDVTGLTFDQILGAVVAHEIVHSTNENESLKASGKDIEPPADKVSAKVVQEEKAKGKKDEKK